MYCPQCGTELAADCKFCPKCGKQIRTQDKIAEPNLADSALPKFNPPEAAPQSQKYAGLTKKQTTKLYIWAVLLLISYSVLLPVIIYGQIYGSNDAQQSRPLGQAIFGLMIWTGWLFSYYWKATDRRGWVGGVIGVSVSIVLVMVSAMLGGAIRGYSQQKVASEKLATLSNNAMAEHGATQEKLHAALVQAANEVNAEVPITIGKETIVTGLSVYETTVIYDIKVKDYSTSQIPSERVTRLLAADQQRQRHMWCSTPGMRELLNWGATVKSALYDKNDVHFGETSISKADCN